MKYLALIFLLFLGCTNQETVCFEQGPNSAACKGTTPAPPKVIVTEPPVAVPPVVQPAEPTVVEKPPGDLPPTVPGQFDDISLAWENTTAPHPERKPWTKALIQYIDLNFDDLSKAQDLKHFCPNFDQLSRHDQDHALGELIVGTVYYESGYDPNSQDVDVGSKSDRDTWSIGLLQLSVVDQESYQIPLGLDFDGLLVPQNNLHLGVLILARQIRLYKVFAIPVGSKGLYFATLHPGGSYDETDNIVARVKKYSPVCL